MLRRVAVLILCTALAACGAEEQPRQSSAAPAAVPAPAAAPAPAPAPAGPPTVGGVYTVAGCEGEGGCPYRNWRTIEPTPLLAERNAAARVVATLAPGEWVAVESVETRLVPKRGVVREATQTLRAGEIVYQLEYEGEGFTNYWVRGASSVLDEEVKVDWAPQTVSPQVQATLGLWAKVKRTNGQVGWLHEPRFECMGQLAGDANCRD